MRNLMAEKLNCPGRKLDRLKAAKQLPRPVADKMPVNKTKSLWAGAGFKDTELCV
jgi:hypothetical protein